MDVRDHAAVVALEVNTCVRPHHRLFADHLAVGREIRSAVREPVGGQVVWVGPPAAGFLSLLVFVQDLRAVGVVGKRH